MKQTTEQPLPQPGTGHNTHSRLDAGAETRADQLAERDLAEIQDSLASDQPRDLSGDQLDFLRNFHDTPSENPEEDAPAEGTARAEWLRRKLIGAEGMRRADEWAENELTRILAERDEDPETKRSDDVGASTQTGEGRKDPAPTRPSTDSAPRVRPGDGSRSAVTTDMVAPTAPENQPTTRLQRVARSAGRFVGQRLGSAEEARTEHQAEFKARRNERSAKRVADNELVRNPDNNGKSLKRNYKEGQQVVRERVVDALLEGELYSRDPRDFGRRLKAIHTLAVRGGYGGRHDVSRDSQNEGAVVPGEFRVNMINFRSRQAQKVAAKARVSGDAYAKLFEGRNVENERSIHMDGIPEEGLATEQVTLGDRGQVLEYRYRYPEANHIPDYIDQYNALGLRIQRLLADPEPDMAQAVRLIGRQYQYGALMRPFQQVNNSLFMNVANAQLKLFGLRGVSHGELDLEAQRVSQSTFERWFTDHVRAAQR